MFLKDKPFIFVSRQFVILDNTTRRAVCQYRGAKKSKNGDVRVNKNMHIVDSVYVMVYYDYNHKFSKYHKMCSDTKSVSASNYEDNFPNTKQKIFSKKGLPR